MSRLHLDPKNLVFRLPEGGPQPAPFIPFKPKETVHIVVKLLQPED